MEERDVILSRPWVIRVVEEIGDWREEGLAVLCGCLADSAVEIGW